MAPKKDQYERNPLLDLPRVGPTAAARILGYANPQTFKRKLPDLPRIRSVEMRKGRYYILADLLAARHNDASKAEIEHMTAEYVEKTRDGARNRKRHQWIGPGEAARICGFRSGATFKRRLPELAKIQTVERRRGKYYELRDVFSAIFPEADDGQLDRLLIDYKKQRAQQRLKGEEDHENHRQHKEQHRPKAEDLSGGREGTGGEG